jgi:hypothetical protein
VEFLTSLVAATKTLIKNNNIATFDSFPGPLPINPVTYSSAASAMKSYLKEGASSRSRIETVDEADWKEENWHSQCERCYKFEVNALQNRIRRNLKTSNCFSFRSRTPIMGLAPNNVPGPGAYYRDTSFSGPFEHHPGFSFGNPKPKREGSRWSSRSMPSLNVSSSLYDLKVLQDKISTCRPYDRSNYKKVAEDLTRREIFIPPVASQRSINKTRCISNFKALHAQKGVSSLSGHIHPGRHGLYRQGRKRRQVSYNGQLGDKVRRHVNAVDRPRTVDYIKWGQQRAVSSFFKKVLSESQRHEYPHSSVLLKRGAAPPPSPIKPISRFRSAIRESKGKSYQSAKLEMVIINRASAR